MMTDDHFQARLIALELLFRGMMTGLVSKTADPIADIDRMEEEFRSSSSFLRFGVEDDHAELIRELVVGFIGKNFDAIRSRVLHDAEIEAAKAGPKN
jgi:hypothetical protein